MKYPLRFIVSYVQPVTQHFGSRTALLQSIHTERNGAMCPTYINLIQNSQTVKKECGPQKGYGEKRCEIQGRSQEMAVMVG